MAILIILICFFILIWGTVIHELMHALMCKALGLEPTIDAFFPKGNVTCVGLEKVRIGGIILYETVPYLLDFIVLIAIFIAGIILLKKDKLDDKISIIILCVSLVIVMNTVSLFTPNQQNDLTIMNLNMNLTGADRNVFIPLVVLLFVAIILLEILIWCFHLYRKIYLGRMKRANIRKA